MTAKKDILIRLYEDGSGGLIPDSGCPLSAEAAKHIETLREELSRALNALHVISMLSGEVTKRELQAWARDRRGTITATLGDPNWLKVGERVDCEG